MSSGVDRNIVATSKQYLDATQSIYLKQQFDIDAESKDFRGLLKAKRSGEYSTPDHMRTNPFADGRPTPEEMKRRKMEMAMMDEPSPDMMKSIQKSYKEMKDKKKPAMALVISVGPKMPKKPIDTATPDKMKKYGSMKKAWGVLKENMEVSDSPEFNLCPNCDGKGKLSHVNSKGIDFYGEGGQMCEDCEGTGYIQQNNPAFAAMQQKLTGEPMDLAFRLLKAPNLPKTPLQPPPSPSPSPSRKFHSMGINEGTISAPRFDPNKQPKLTGNELEELRAARDAARAQMGQPNPDRGGDVEPI